jgi:hypothetical protein
LIALSRRLAIAPALRAGGASHGGRFKCRTTPFHCRLCVSGSASAGYCHSIIRSPRGSLKTYRISHCGGASNTKTPQRRQSQTHSAVVGIVACHRNRPKFPRASAVGSDIPAFSPMRFVRGWLRAAQTYNSLHKPVIRYEKLSIGRPQVPGLAGPTRRITSHAASYAAAMLSCPAPRAAMDPASSNEESPGAAGSIFAPLARLCLATSYYF